MINPKKTSSSRKDPLKTPKVWEKARREKMKIYFNELQQVLPFYDPSTPMSRFEILQKSKSYIKDLQDQNQDLLNGGFDEVYKNKMTKLKLRVKELLRRVDQLTDLLRTANIMIPPIEANSKGLKNLNNLKWMSQRPKKWTEKINLVVPDDKIKNVLTLIKDYKKKAGKINTKKKQCMKKLEKFDNMLIGKNLIKCQEKKKKLQKRPTSSKISDNIAFDAMRSSGQFKENQPVDFNLLSNTSEINGDNGNNDNKTPNSKSCNNCSDNKIPGDNNNIQGNSTSLTENQKTTKSSVQFKSSKDSISKIEIVQTAQQNSVISTPANVLPSHTFILTNDGNLVQLPILNSTGTVINGNSNLLTTATILKPNTGLLTPIVINKPSPLIVLQKPSPQIIQTAQIFNASPQVISVSQPSIQILHNSIVHTSANHLNTRTLPHILSKPPANKKRIIRDSTVTTYVNKIPIPALSKLSFTKSSTTSGNLDHEKTINEINKENEVIKKVVEEVQEDKISDRQNSEENNIDIQKPETKSTKRKKDPKNFDNNKNTVENTPEQNSENNSENQKKQKLEDKQVENLFKPIENPLETDSMFCNLTLQHSENPSLSVSPTAAFLSSFPIVAPNRSEVDEDLNEKKEDDGGKITKENMSTETSNLEKRDSNSPIKNGSASNISKEFLSVLTTQNQILNHSTIQEKKNEENEQIKLLGNTNQLTNNNNNFIINSNSSSKVSSNKNSNTDCTVNIKANPPTHFQQKQQQQQKSQQQIESCKTWAQYNQDDCGIRSDTFFLPSNKSILMSNGEISAPVPVPSSSYIIPSAVNNSHCSTYSQNSTVKNNAADIQNITTEQSQQLKSNQFDFSQKRYVNKSLTFNAKKPCSGSVNDSYNVSKTQTNNYQIDSSANYELIPVKETPNHRNARTVNWMTEPDIRNQNVSYGSVIEKMPTGGKPSLTAPTYLQSDNFYMTNQISKTASEYPGQFMTSDQSKVNYQKNDLYGKDQRCKGMDKRNDQKCYSKTSQNSYNIFDYNCAGSCYVEDTNKYSNVQSCATKNKKNINVNKKKSEDIHQINNDQLIAEHSKRLPEQILGNIDFNSVSNQECFTWIPGKNVDWLPSKSFCLDSNLVVPSTLPTLVGDLALGTTSTNDLQNKPNSSKIYQSNSKQVSNELGKEYLDLGMNNNITMAKSMEVSDTNKQYLEPFANLSKNIFEITPSTVHNPQFSKNDFDKVNFLGNNSSETIVLKNIFELPVSKSSSGSEFTRSKQRIMNSNQNNFLSVSQLVEPPPFEGSSIKNESHVNLAAGKSDICTHNYSNYSNTLKTYKTKNRSSHCKFNERKCNGYKNTNYTAEALIRSNNVNYQPNEFSGDVNANFFTGKSGQKSEQFISNNKIDFDIQGPNQNLYSDFNFSSPVPSFTISSSVGGTDFGNHDVGGNFTTQNNSFLGDLITPEYPLSDNVSNTLLLPPCSIALQNPFVIDKRNVPGDKNKTHSKQLSTSRSRKHYEGCKTTFNDFTIPSNSAIFTTSSLSCPSIFTTSSCQNLLPVPTQSIPITFPSPSFSSSNISFPPLPTSSSNNYPRFSNSNQNSTSGSFLPSSTMFTTCSSNMGSSTQNSYASNSLKSVTNSVITSFPVSNVSFSSSSQPSLPFFSLSNPIIPPSAPTSSSNSLANFNLSTIFPEINQKGNYHYS